MATHSTAAEPVPPPTSKTSLATAKTNLRYLISGPGGAAAPASLTTRSALRTTRYVLRFLFWRLLRYGKYALIAAGTSALAGSALAGVVPIAGAILVPSVPVAAAIGLTTAVIKFGWRHRGNHFRQAWLVGGEGRDARKDEQNDADDAARAFNGPGHRRADQAFRADEFGG